MNYRRLGHSGLKVSELSPGSWVRYHDQVDEGAAKVMGAAIACTASSRQSSSVAWTAKARRSMLARIDEVTLSLGV